MATAGQQTRGLVSHTDAGQVADLAAGDEGLHPFVVLAVPVEEVHADVQPAALDQLQQLCFFINGGGDRLLRPDVLAARQRLPHQGRPHVRQRGDGNRIDGRIGKDRGGIVGHADAREGIVQLNSHLRIEVGDGDKLPSGIIGDSLGGAPTHATCADDGDFQWDGHGGTPGSRK